MMDFSKNRSWLVWLVSVLALLWYLSGAVTIFLAQAGRLPGISAEEAAYYAAQPGWFVVLTDISLLSAIIGSVTLPFRPQPASRLFALSLTTIVITNAYDLFAGTSRVLASRSALVATAVIVVLAVLLAVYSRHLAAKSSLSARQTETA